MNTHGALLYLGLSGKSFSSAPSHKECLTTFSSLALNSGMNTLWKQVGNFALQQIVTKD
jgi:hypothetical protein